MSQLNHYTTPSPSVSPLLSATATLTHWNFFLHSSYDQAMQLYDAVLEKTPTHIAVWKRKVAVHRARGETAEAVKELTQLLDV